MIVYFTDSFLQSHVLFREDIAFLYPTQYDIYEFQTETMKYFEYDKYDRLALPYRESRLLEEMQNTGSNPKYYSVAVNDECNINVITQKVYRPIVLLFRFSELPVPFFYQI